MDVKEDAEDVNVWDIIFQCFPLLSGAMIPKQRALHPRALYLIHEHGLTETVKGLIIRQLERTMPSVADTFWAHFPQFGEDQPVPATNGFQLFSDAVIALCSSFETYSCEMEQLQQLIEISGCRKLPYNATDTMELLKIILRATLHCRLNDFNLSIIREFYRVSFKVFLHSESDEEITCSGCENASENCLCQEIMEIFQDVNRRLMILGLLERITGEILTTLIDERIETHVKETCKGTFDTSYIETLENWLKSIVIGWMRLIYFGRTETSMETIKIFEQKLMHSLYHTYTKTRIDQLFNIIIEYPDSQPAIEDLKICIEKTDLRAELSNRLQRDLVNRLLHPGVNTVDVLTAYVSAIKALRQLDPTGVLLESVTQPVKHYLRNREDTIKCIINSLIDEGPSELADELVKGEKSPMSDAPFTDEDVENWEQWMPDPVDADSTKPSKNRRTSDVISMLVNVYGSKDLFVKEYTTLLAERLLSATNYKTEKEYRNLELLKLRFGEAELHSCEVMLKDIYDSKRISNTHIEDIEPEFLTSAKILSAPFWPAFKEETLELPEYVQAQLKTFTRAFEKQKGNRTLCWKPHLGSVQLEIELADKIIEVTTTPTRATILWHFQTKKEWSVEDLSSLIKVPPMKLRREITFWQAQGLLREAGNDRFILAEEGESTGRNNVSYEIGGEEDETESVMASAQDQREEELGLFWQYVVGMLTNLDSMPLDRIHQMLKMFATQGSTSVECSQHALEAFLDRKVREHKLILSGGIYRLPKL